MQWEALILESGINQSHALLTCVQGVSVCMKFCTAEGIELKGPSRCICTHAHTRVHARTYARTHARTHTRTHARAWARTQHTHTHTHTHVYIHVYVDQLAKQSSYSSKHVSAWALYCYGVASMSRLLKIIGLFCKRAL